jgi:hypothetical protein
MLMLKKLKGSELSRLRQWAPAAAFCPQPPCVIRGSKLRVLLPISKKLSNVCSLKEVLNHSLLN